MWVVKLGGSLAATGSLGVWLATLAARGGGRAVIVPGGGPFADLVREAQESLGFSDAVAHRMAILAMEQYGLMLAGMQPELVPVESAEALQAVLRNARVAIWLPGTMTKGALDIPASWNITSDSLAAWLANALSAERLMLVKACQVSGTLDAESLRDQGIVDPAFPDFIADRGFETYVLGANDHACLKTMLGDPLGGAPQERRVKPPRRARQ